MSVVNASGSVILIGGDGGRTNGVDEEAVSKGGQAGGPSVVVAGVGVLAVAAIDTSDLNARAMGHTNHVPWATPREGVMTRICDDAVKPINRGRATLCWC